jgi:pyridoxal phosphate enzyme (YggS family)
MPPIEDNVAAVRERIHRAAQRAGRDPGEIELLAVSKTMPLEIVREGYRAGLRQFGENRIQEGAAKVDQAADGLPGAVWHFIGHLQSNKARDAARCFQLIHTVDSEKLARRLDNWAGEFGVRRDVLLQVHQGDEATKHGADEGDLPRLAATVRELPNLRLCGLMTIPPWGADPEEVRPWFRRLRELRDQLAESEAAGLDHFRQLSMGMSHDLEVAVEEGATIIRVGTALFGPRRPRA